MSVPTAEEFLKEAQSNPNKGWTTRKLMIEFAKLHVEAALKEASEKVEYDVNHDTLLNYFPVVIDKDSILNAYPLENIK
jgi:hypothetical protein